MDCFYSRGWTQIFMGGWLFDPPAARGNVTPRNIYGSMEFRIYQH